MLALRRITAQARAHGTQSLPAIPGRYLGELLQSSDPAAR